MKWGCPELRKKNIISKETFQNTSAAEEDGVIKLSCAAETSTYNVNIMNK